MMYESFAELFDDIISLKQHVTSLTVYDRVLFKRDFFKLDFKEWQLSLIWEFFWDDKTYDQLYLIFLNKRLIKKDGDQLGKRQY